MIILKIKDKGLYVEIPNVTPFRTPAEVDISHTSMHLVASKLQAQGINQFEIISDTRGKEKKYNQDDFMDRAAQVQKVRSQEKRIKALEKKIQDLVKQIPSQNSEKEEQINKKLDSITELLLKQSQNPQVIIQQEQERKTSYETKKMKKEPVEEKEFFVPKADIKGFSTKGSSTKTTERDETDVDSIVDLLSNLDK